MESQMEVSCSEYHRALTMAMDRAATAQQEYNKERKYKRYKYSIDCWVAAAELLPPEVIQLVHQLNEHCSKENQNAQCFCIKLGGDGKPKYFVTRHRRGSCPHRSYSPK